MKKIISIKGKSNTGKSSSIIEVFKHFDKTSVAVYKKDICETVKIGDCLIGFCSQGDPNSLLADWLKKLFDLGCDIIICACRTKGKTIKIVESYSEKGYLVEYMRVAEIQNPTAEKIESHIEVTKVKIIDFILKNTNNNGK